MNKRTAALAAALILATAASIAGADKARYKPGDKVAPFELKNEHNRTVSLAQYKGKIVVLDFYASWCPDCNKDAPELEKQVWEKYRSKNVQVLGVAIAEGDGAEAKMSKFRKDHGITYPLLHDENARLLSDFGFTGIPQGIVLDNNGRYVAAPTTIEEFTASLKKLLK